MLNRRVVTRHSLLAAKAVELALLGEMDALEQSIKEECALCLGLHLCGNLDFSGGPMRRLTSEQSALLDCIRGLSAMAVMVGHALPMLPNPPMLGTRYPLQSYAVILFFALSGFLIAYNCMVKRDYSFSHYAIDRFSRIFTAFIPAIMLVALIDPLYGRTGEANSMSTFVANLLMLHHTPFDRLVPALPRFEPFGSGRQFWSVAVEWWLYMLFGILFFLRPSSWRERQVMALLFLPAVLVVLFFTAHESVGLVWVAASLGAIAFCSFTPSERTRSLSYGATIFFGFMLYRRFVFLDPGSPFNFYDLNFMILSTGLLLSLICLAAESPVFARVLSVSSGFWVWLSSISYSLFLTHQTFHYAWHAKLGVSGWPSLVAMCAVSIVLAWVFTLAFDRHHKKVAASLKSLIGRVRKTPRNTVSVAPKWW
jgi:peptidoglycan/LPS O-acetylase OafA/YrhL